MTDGEQTANQLDETPSTKRIWIEPTLTRLHAGSAEGGDSVAGDNGNLS
jgi:hypothetical protein